MSDFILNGMLLQSSKARLSIVVTLFGIFMLVSDLQYLKALSLIVVTLFGIFTLTRELHFSYLLLVDYQYYTL